MAVIHWVKEEQKNGNWYIKHGTTEMAKTDAKAVEWELRRAGYSVTGIVQG